MDHPCYKCGHSVEDGKPFCPQCSAPQIRVAMPEPSAELASASEGAVPVLDREAGTVFPIIPASPLPVRWSPALRSCVFAAAVAIGLTILGLSPFVGALVAGFLAVVFFRRRGLGATIRSGAGARIGALSGLLFFGVSAILQLLAVAVLHKSPELRGEMLAKAQQAAARYPGPEVQSFIDFVNSPGGFAFMMVASVVVGCFIFIVLGGCGGALGAALLGRHDRP
jgi:hypothetical protein